MTISIKNLSFHYHNTPIFENFSLEAGAENPLVILGPSGCGKTTLLRLMAGLEQAAVGEIRFSGTEAGELWSYVFQENRLLPWLTILENVSLPLRRPLGKDAGEDRARRFLELAGLREKLSAYPAQLSGGEKQRAAIARGFAYPGTLILMDEPFQSLDIPLRISLMDLTRNLLALEDRLLIAVTHDPREAVYLGRRIILLGKAKRGIILDKKVNLPPEERRYASPASAVIEEELVRALGTRDRGLVSRHGLKLTV